MQLAGSPVFIACGDRALAAAAMSPGAEANVDNGRVGHDLVGGDAGLTEAERAEAGSLVDMNVGNAFSRR